MTGKEHLIKALNKNVRYDGRKKLEFRPITVETGVTKNAEGSARVTIGDTEVLAGIKMDVMTPYPDSPDEGTLMVNTELLPMSSPEFEPGPPGQQATEIARVVDRAIRESKTIDVKKLCITPAEKVWAVMIDVVSINDNGNLQDAAALAAIAALKDAKFPALNEHNAIDYDKPLTDKALPVTREPIEVTVIKIGDQFFVDALPAEETLIEARLTVGITEKGTCAALQKGGEEPLSADDLDKMLGIALDIAPTLRKAL